MIGETTSSTPLEDLERRRAEALAMGGEERIARHHACGRLTARERIAALVDDGSWREIGLLALPELRREAPSPGDAIITGLGRIGGRKVCVVAIDATVLAGTTAPVNMRKQNRVAEWAGKRGMPLIFLSDNDGGRLPGPARVALLRRPVRLHARSCSRPPAARRSRASPRCSARASATPRCTPRSPNLVVMKRDASIALSGPPVIKGAIGEDISNEELGGPAVAHETRGSAHVVVDERGRGDRRRQALPLLHARRGRPAGAGGAAGRAGARRGGAAHARPEQPAPRL